LGYRRRSAEEMAEVAVKVVRLWNQGLDSPAITARFGLHGSQLAHMLASARERGERVRDTPRGPPRIRAE
jgi:hypothetical protein